MSRGYTLHTWIVISFTLSENCGLSCFQTLNRITCRSFLRNWPISDNKFRKFAQRFIYACKRRAAIFIKRKRDIGNTSRSFTPSSTCALVTSHSYDPDFQKTHDMHISFLNNPSPNFVKIQRTHRSVKQGHAQANGRRWSPYKVFLLLCEERLKDKELLFYLTHTWRLKCRSNKYQLVTDTYVQQRFSTFQTFNMKTWKNASAFVNVCCQSKSQWPN